MNVQGINWPQRNETGMDRNLSRHNSFLSLLFLYIRPINKSLVCVGGYRKRSKREKAAKDFFFFLSSLISDHKSLFFFLLYDWSEMGRRNEKEMPLRELRSPLRGPPQAIGVSEASGLLNVRSDTKEKWNASAFPFFWLIFWQRTGQLSKTRNCVLAGSPFSFLSFSFLSQDPRSQIPYLLRAIYKIVKIWDPRKRKRRKGKGFVGPQSLIDCTLRVRPHKVKRPLGPGQSLREKENRNLWAWTYRSFPFSLLFFLYGPPTKWFLRSVAWWGGPKKKGKEKAISDAGPTTSQRLPRSGHEPWVVGCPAQRL